MKSGSLMFVYIVYRAERDNKDRSTIPKILRKFGCIQLHKSLWQVSEKNLKSIKSFLQKHQFIVLKRERELKPPILNEENKLIDLGSLVIVAFDLPENQEAGRKAIERLLLQIPYLYLCRSVYAFPQSRGIHGKTIVGKISEIVNGLGGKITILPRMRIMNTFIINDLIQETIKRIEKRLLSIINLSQQVNYEGLSNNANDLKKIKELKVKTLRFKVIVSLYAKWLGLDLTYFIKEAQKILRSLKKV